MLFPQIPHYSAQDIQNQALRIHSLPDDVLKLIFQYLDFLGLYSTPLVCQRWCSIYNSKVNNPGFVQQRKKEFDPLKKQLQVDYPDQWSVKGFVNQFAKDRLVRHGPLVNFLFPPKPSEKLDLYRRKNRWCYGGEYLFALHEIDGGKCQTIVQKNKLTNQSIQDMETNLFRGSFYDENKISLKYVEGHITLTYPPSCARTTSDASELQASEADANKFWMEIIHIQATHVGNRIRMKVPEFTELISSDGDQYYLQNSPGASESDDKKLLMFNKKTGLFKQASEKGRIFVIEEQIFICDLFNKNIHIYNMNLEYSARITISGSYKKKDLTHVKVRLFVHEKCLLFVVCGNSDVMIWDIDSRKRIGDNEIYLQAITDIIEANTVNRGSTCKIS